MDHATASAAPIGARTPVSYPNFVDFREQNHVFSGIAAFTGAGVTLTGFGKPALQGAFLVSANYFDVLGVQAVAGRTFRPDEDRTPGGNMQMVVGQSMRLALAGIVLGLGWRWRSRAWSPICSSMSRPTIQSLLAL